MKREWLGDYSDDDPPPSITCRNTLLMCYLILSEFDRARSVVARAETCKAWEADAGKREMEFVHQVEKVHTLINFNELNAVQETNTNV